MTLAQLEEALDARGGLILKIFKPEIGTRWNVIAQAPGAEERFAGQGTTIEKAIVEALRFYDNEKNERCPGCGCAPGDGKTPGCKNPDGCGA